MFVSDISVNLERIQLLVELKIRFFSSGMNSVHRVPDCTDVMLIKCIYWWYFTKLYVTYSFGSVRNQSVNNDIL